MQFKYDVAEPGPPFHVDNGGFNVAPASMKACRRSLLLEPQRRGALRIFASVRRVDDYSTQRALCTDDLLHRGRCVWDHGKRKREGSGQLSNK